MNGYNGWDGRDGWNRGNGGDGTEIMDITDGSDIGFLRLSGKLVGAGVNPSESEKEEFFINDSPESASKTFDFGIERFCGGVG